MINWEESRNMILFNLNDEEKRINESNARGFQRILNEVFNNYGIKAECVDYNVGLVFTQLLIDYLPKGTPESIEKNISAIMRSFGGKAVRFNKMVPNTSYSEIEVNNEYPCAANYSDYLMLLSETNFSNLLTFPVGKDINNRLIYADIRDLPHLLIAGSSDSGKTTFLHSVITTLCNKTSIDLLRIGIIDDTGIEMNLYKNLDHLLCPIINDRDEALCFLKRVVDLINKRYQMFKENNDIASISEYNAWASEKNKEVLPYIVIVINGYDSLAFSHKEICMNLLSILGKGRLVGVHAILSIENPNPCVLPGTLKSLINSRIAFHLSNPIHSSMVLDDVGAECLYGFGDMLIKSPRISREGVVRAQGLYISKDDIKTIIKEKTLNGPFYQKEFLELKEYEECDSYVENTDKYEEIKEWVLTQEFVSLSKMQKSCAIGFNRAGKTIIRLQEEGILSKESSGERKGFKVIKKIK